MLQNLFNETCITLLPKTGNNTSTKENNKQHLSEHSWKILDKILTKHNKRHMKNILHQDQVYFITECKDGSTCANKYI